MTKAFQSSEFWKAFFYYLNVKEFEVLNLVELSVSMEAAFIEFHQALMVENPKGSWLFEYKGEPFDMFVQKLEDWTIGVQLPEGWVPCSTYFLVDKTGQIVGKSSLRHDLNNYLRNIGGHIGYIIRPDQRRKGYGYAILRLTLEKAREMGLLRVLVTCDEDNSASAKIIEKNGGVFENTYQEDENTVLERRYWITL